MKIDKQLRTEMESLAVERGMKLKLKSKSHFMRFLGFLLFFNRAFMSRYTTVIGSTVYFPDETWADDQKVWQTLCHELTHWEDNKRLKLLFPIVYLSPQIFALLALLAFVNLWFLLFLVLLAPLPSPGRKWAEMRGYAVSMAVLYWRYGRIGDEAIDHFVSQFTTAKYYFIWPFPKAVRAELMKWKGRIEGGALTASIPAASLFQPIVQG
jgi:hypothetical protein